MASLLILVILANTQSISRASASSPNCNIPDTGGANLQGADLEYCNLAGYNMQGDNLNGANLYGANLQSANLQSANLQSANLHNANLETANLQGTSFQRANLSGANIQGDNLSGDNLSGDNLQGANLQGANLQGANAENAIFADANLSGANFSGAEISGTNFVDASVSGCNGCIPPLPNEAGCYTIELSQANSGWQTVACLSPALASALPHPNEGGSTGIEGVGGSGGTTNIGEVNIQFSEYSGEHDSGSGESNEWSIQANTAFFTGSNGDSSVVQFTEQNFNIAGDVCVWEVDATLQLYPNKCVSTTLQTLSASYNPNVIGYTSNNGGINYLNAQFCSPTNCWVATMQDNIGLTGHWSDIEGTILGMGDSSMAVFTSPTSLTATAYTAGTSSFNGYAENLGTITLETNNLNENEHSFSCSGNSCETITLSSI